jgi:carbonic anhydrase/acetyltransferase-like protein (isoleucine patch superfamily)
MTITEQRHVRRLRVAGGMLYSSWKAVLYFLSFLGPVWVISRFRTLPIPVLLAMSVVGYGVAGLAFLGLNILTKKVLIGPIDITGRVTIEDPGVKRWFLAAMLTVIVDTGPFHAMTIGLSLLAPWYYRGMGAKMPDSVLIGVRALIFEPWFLEAGENVNIGADAVILGHRGEGKNIILGRVIIGDGALVGMRAVIFPDVRIGNHANIAAGAVVLSGTNIPDGETWAGIPARRVGKEPTADSIASQ